LANVVGLNQLLEQLTDKVDLSCEIVSAEAEFVGRRAPPIQRNAFIEIEGRVDPLAES
jgi:hypothetical protein